VVDCERGNRSLFSWIDLGYWSNGVVLKMINVIIVLELAWGLVLLWLIFRYDKRS